MIDGMASTFVSRLLQDPPTHIGGFCFCVRQGEFAIMGPTEDLLPQELSLGETFYFLRGKSLLVRANCATVVVAEVGISLFKEAPQKGAFFVSQIIDPEGYIKFWRKTQYNDFLMNDNNAYLLFTKLWMFANKRNGTYTTGRYALAERVNLNPSTAYKALKRLESNRLVTLESNSRRTVISICNWSTYQSGSISSGSSQVTAGEQPGSSQVTLNKNKKENKNSTNVLSAKPRTRSVEIDEIFEYWESKVGYPIQSQIKYNRFAASNLLKKHGPEKLHQLIDGVAMAQDDQYAPRISDLRGLQAKLSDLMAWGRSRQSEGTKVWKAAV